MSAAAASSNPLAELGWRPTEAKTPSCTSAAAIASRLEVSSSPTVRIRRTPVRLAVGHELAVSGLADAEMGVRIDHGRSLGGRPYPLWVYAAAASIFGKRGGSFSTDWPPPCEPNAWISRPSTRSASSIRSPVSGMYAVRSSVVTRSPSARL